MNKGYETKMNLKLIQIAGLKDIPSEVTLNGIECVSGPTEVSIWA